MKKILLFLLGSFVFFEATIFAQQRNLPSQCSIQISLPVGKHIPPHPTFKRANTFLIRLVTGENYEAEVLVSRKTPQSLITKPKDFVVTMEARNHGSVFNLENAPCQSGMVTITGYKSLLQSTEEALGRGIFSYDFPIPLREEESLFIDLVTKKIYSSVKKRTAESCEMDFLLPFGIEDFSNIEEVGKFTGDKPEDYSTIQSFLVTFSIEAGGDAKYNPAGVATVIVNKDLSLPIVEPSDKISATLSKDKKSKRVMVRIKVAACFSFFSSVFAYAKPFKSVEEAKKATSIFFLRFDGMQAVSLKEDETIGKVVIDILTKEVRVVTKKRAKQKFTSGKVIYGESNVKNKRTPKKNMLDYVSTFASDFTTITDLSAMDKYLFFTTGYSETLEIYAVANPAKAKHIASFSAGKTSKKANKLKTKKYLYYSEWDKVKIAGSYAYVLNGGYGAKKDLLIVDVSKPASPKLLSSYDSGSEPVDLIVKGKQIYLLTRKAFQILDASHPKKVKLISSYSLNLEKDADLFSMKHRGNMIYIVGYKVGLLVLDVSDTTQITQTFQWKSENSVLGIGIFGDSLIVNEVDITGKSPSNIVVFNISKPRPKFVKTIPLTPKEGLIDLLASDGRLYAGTVTSPQYRSKKQFQGIEIYAVKDGAELKWLDGYSPDDIGCPFRLLLDQGSYLFLATKGCGLIVAKKIKNKK